MSATESLVRVEHEGAVYYVPRSLVASGQTPLPHGSQTGLHSRASYSTGTSPTRYLFGGAYAG